MNIIATIKERLSEYPNLRFEEDSDGISVAPEGGFTVWAKDHGNSYTVGFDGWHEGFEKAEDALNCFGWGLSNQCRLEVTSRGGKAHKWTAQYFENGNWINDSTTGLLVFPFWRKKTIGYKQNAVINS